MTPGQAAYEKSAELHTGLGFPPWEKLTTKEKDNWEEIAMAARIQAVNFPVRIVKLGSLYVPLHRVVEITAEQEGCVLRIEGVPVPVRVHHNVAEVLKALNWKVVA